MGKTSSMFRHAIALLCHGVSWPNILDMLKLVASWWQ